ncbi:hypothetical protein F0562_000457 [Nyssa sinensis]|uniref:Protein kinase domain-containing protein n=1 Tax=Nyssa sinensis TaxID=561372 RepID=A0A5J5C033_9ASTE|nr:hypothetical protein F0562_000457 [Nyssa sinensis]
MAHEEEEPRKVQFPLDSNCYQILDEIGRGVSAIVYKAICLPMNSTVVAIKAIDLDRSRADFDDVRREAKTMSLLSHPNILRAHCSFTVDRRLWVVMPFMSAGSLQSIVLSSFPDGHLHRDIKAGNILIDSNGSVKLTDFGVSASIYESYSAAGSSAVSSSASSLMLTDVAGTPYWMAPEVIHSHTGYSLKADIWSFGITALELAHGRPPLSHLPPSKSLIMKITKRFRFSDYDKNNNSKKKFSKYFKDMVGLCLDQDPSKRPSADKLLKHSFFKNCKGSDFLVKNVLQGLPTVEQRFKKTKLLRLASMNKSEEDEDDDELLGEKIKERRISGWNFNIDGFELDPVFPTGKVDDINIVKKVRFGGEMVIQEKGRDSDTSNASSQGQNQVGGEGVGHNGGDGGGEAEIDGGGVNPEVMMGSLLFLKHSLENQKQNVSYMIGLLHGEESVEASREEQLMQVIEKLRSELENEKKKKFELEMELENLKLQLSNASD